ncbi:MAG: hypothetical protein II661_05380 [Bacteroidales bacterium]|jgi:hypothetical protein|nr:hypothetical protein [Bacteroidales bacterium]
MKKFRFLAIAMATMLTLGMVSCGPKDEDVPYEGITLNNGEFIEIDSYGTDTTAAYKLHFKVYLSDGSLVIENLTNNHNISGLPDMACTTGAKIADAGKVKGIAKIDEIPAAGDFGNSAPATEKHGYVVEAKGTQNLDAYSNPNIHDPATQYMRIWLEEATDNGFKLRYEFPFTPAE